MKCGKCKGEGHNARTCKGKGKKRGRSAPPKGKGKGKAKAKPPAKKKARKSTTSKKATAKFYAIMKHYDYHNFDPSWGEEAVTDTDREGPFKTEKAAEKAARAFFGDWDHDECFVKYKERISKSKGHLFIFAEFEEGEVRKAWVIRK